MSCFVKVNDTVAGWASNSLASYLLEQGYNVFSDMTCAKKLSQEDIKITNNESFSSPTHAMRKIRQVTLEEAKAMGIDVDALRKEG